MKDQMKIQTIRYDSPIEAFSALVRSLLIYEQRYHMSSEDFYAQYQAGKLDDSADFVEWAGDYQHYLSLKSELEQRLKEKENE
jgi:hypothetical protein